MVFHVFEQCIFAPFHGKVSEDEDENENRTCGILVVGRCTSGGIRYRR